MSGQFSRPRCSIERMMTHGKIGSVESRALYVHIWSCSRWMYILHVAAAMRTKARVFSLSLDKTIAHSRVNSLLPMSRVLFPRADIDPMEKSRGETAGRVSASQ